MRKIIINILLAISFSFFVMPVTHAEEINYYDIIYSEVSMYNKQEPEWITNAILYASSTYEIDPLLLTALLEQESKFNLNAISNAGAIGIAQLMPDTASMIGVDPYNPLENILGGASYLRTQIDNFSYAGQYNVTYALAAYNAGANAIYSNNGIPPYTETIDYIYCISDIFNRLNNYRFKG